MDIVIPLAHTSRNDDFELKFALRSFEQNLSFDQVWVIGYMPAWATEFNVLPYSDRNAGGRRKEKDVYDRLMLACKDERISDPFLYANDDHILLNMQNINCFPYYYSGSIAGKIEKLDGRTPYRNTLINTEEICPGSLNFDVHCPMIIEKERFIKAFENLEWPEWGYCMKTVYFYRSVLDWISWPVESKDLKLDDRNFPTISHDELSNLPYFSLGEALFSGETKRHLKQLFPNKSKFEL